MGEDWDVDKSDKARRALETLEDIQLVFANRTAIDMRLTKGGYYSCPWVLQIVFNKPGSLKLKLTGNTPAVLKEVARRILPENIFKKLEHILRMKNFASLQIQKRMPGIEATLDRFAEEKMKERAERAVAAKAAIEG